MSAKTIENMVDWIEKNLDENPTLEAMSDYVGYSSFYCSSKFHQMVGISFKDYVAKRKLTMAAIELRETKSRVIDIAMKYGFSSNEAFTRAFFRSYGYTPCKFRSALPVVPLFERPQTIHTL